MIRKTAWVVAAALLFACSSDDSTSGSGGTGGKATGGTGGSTTGGTGGSATGGTGGATGGTGGSTGGTGGGTGGATGGTGGATGGAAGAATGGAAGAATGGAAGAATGGTGGTGGGQACTWGSGATCPKGEYCNAPGCGAGKCAPIPAETDTKTPVCGCDGVTYWNASVAGHASMSVKGSGTCSTGAKNCGGIAGLQCPTGTFCNYELSSSAMCNASDQSGMCWGMPTKCPTILIGPQTRECKATKCTSECDLIKGGKIWYPDNTCPT